MSIETLAPLMSTGKDDWGTPPALFARYRDEFGITVDLAANASNALCEEWFGPDHSLPTRQDALKKNWYTSGGNAWAWCNPPYSRGLQGKFVAFCADRRRVVMLLPARTDTKAFHSYIWDEKTHAPREGVEVRFIRGRVKFVGAEHGAPFPSMIVVFR